MKQNWTTIYVNGVERREARRLPTGNTVPCPGEAHKNHYIDNCMSCAPRWGIVDELAPIDIEAARKADLIVNVNDLPFDLHEKILASGEARHVPVERRRRGKGYMWYQGLEFVTAAVSPTQSREPSP